MFEIYVQEKYISIYLTHFLMLKSSGLKQEMTLWVATSERKIKRTVHLTL